MNLSFNDLRDVDDEKLVNVISSVNWAVLHNIKLNKYQMKEFLRKLSSKELKLKSISMYRNNFCHASVLDYIVKLLEQVEEIKVSVSSANIQQVLQVMKENNILTQFCGEDSNDVVLTKLTKSN